jgi:hypothetical protein
MKTGVEWGNRQVGLLSGQAGAIAPSGTRDRESPARRAEPALGADVARSRARSRQRKARPSARSAPRAARRSAPRLPAPRRACRFGAGDRAGWKDGTSLVSRPVGFEGLKSVNDHPARAGQRHSGEVAESSPIAASRTSSVRRSFPSAFTTYCRNAAVDRLSECEATRDCALSSACHAANDRQHDHPAPGMIQGGNRTVARHGISHEAR